MTTTNLPYDTRKGLFSPNTSEGIVSVFTITRPGIVTYRFTNFEGAIFNISDPELRSGIVHAGHQYTYAIVNSETPDDVPGSLATIPLTLENVQQDLGALALESVNKMVVTLKYIAKSDPATIVATFPDFLVTSCTADFQTRTVTLQLSTDVSQNEPTNMHRFVPSQFGALFP